MRQLFAVFCLLMSLSASASPVVPDTPAGRVFTAMLSAFNSGDARQIAAYDRAYRTVEIPVKNTMHFRNLSGGYTLLRVEASEPTVLTVLLQDVYSDTVRRVVFRVTDEPEPKLLKTDFSVVPTAPEFKTVRLPAAQAVASLQALAARLAAEDRFSGTLLVARRGKVLLSQGWGLADREAKTPVTVATQFRLASMTKMFTAVAILQLAEAGKLGLDDKIGKFLPDYPNKDMASKVTVRHLLMHTGVTGDIFGPEYEANRLALHEHADYIRLYGKRGLVDTPGERFRYSNYGYVLLGAIIEAVSGMSYHDYLDAKIYRPAGMTASGSLPETAMVPARAKGYMRSGDAWVSHADTLVPRGMAAGGSYSTVGDLLLFAQALQAGTLISAASLELALAPNTANYGLGFMLDGTGKMRSFGHTGGAAGMSTALRIEPETGYVYIALSNLDRAVKQAMDHAMARMPID